MEYIKLTGRQARYFNVCGKILIVEKLTPQPKEVSAIGPWIEIKDGLRLVDAPYYVGEIVEFIEPVWINWEKHDFFYESDGMPVKEHEYRYLAHPSKPSFASRGRGKCVGNEARKLALMTRDKFDLTAHEVIHATSEDWCFFSLFERENL